MAEWFVGPIMDKIINTCSDYLEDRFRSQTSVKKELKRLRKNHLKIQAVVDYANQAQISNQNTPLNKWIWQLRDAIDETEDLLDEFEYCKHKEQLAKDTEETKKRKATSFLPESAQKILKVGEGVLKIDPKLKRLEEAVQKLDEVSAEVGTFLRLLKSTKQKQQEQELEFHKTRETGYLPKNDLIGRSKDREFLMQWLRKPTNEEHQTPVNATDLYRNISLLSVVGHGGMGKTTLLQHVYEDEMTKEFDLKMWVCVSNNFDVKKVIADMLESFTMKRPALESLAALQRSLKSEVMSKKFLLVMDDIWEEEEESDKIKWENVLAPLAYGSLGSRILVTTRMESAALIIAKVIKKKMEKYGFEGLEEDECLQLLNSHAFANVENPNDYKKLRSIAAKIVKKLSGSPLAAKVIGGVLNSSLDERHWTNILNGAKLGQDSIILILRLSYIFLPNYLQICFSFCCLFPQDHEFDKDDLVRMWIALGFIQPSHIQGETMEDIGGRYFDILVNKSFFEKFRYSEYYKMHDLLHELAHNIFAQECLRVVGDEEFPLVNHKTLRHLSVRTTNLDVLRKIGKFKKLHSLFLFFDAYDQDPGNLLIEIFNASRSIRLLCISAPRLEMIPEEIGSLIHLRYLTIKGSNVKMLPKNLSNLHHLQFIIYEDIWNSERPVPDDFLPSDMNNLFNLRYLNLCNNIIPPPIRRIGKLNLLQRLPVFSLRNEDGYKIEELELMNDLRQLGIKGLENVNDVDEACSAKLFNKKNLTDLSLEWGDNQSRNRFNLDENVLDNLQPPESIKELSIKNYMGTRSAKWMNDASLINNIEYITLEYCMQWQALPPFGQLPFLKSLKIVGMPKVKWLDNNFLGNDNCCAFPSLEQLHIDGFEALEDWFNAGIAAEDGCLFPCLTQLELKNCPKLKELPSLPSKLKRLIICNIGWKTLNCGGISSIGYLRVSCCPNITDIPLANEIARLASLRYLTIQDCPNLISLGGRQEVEATEKCQFQLNNLTINDPSILLLEPLRSITFLRDLNITTNSDLVSFSIEAEQWFLKIQSSLYALYLRDLKALQSFHFSLESFSSLKQLVMYDVPQLQQLPKLPTSLEILSLRKLESLQCLPSLSAISSLRELTLRNIPLLKSLPNLPTSLNLLSLDKVESLQCIPSLSAISSLQTLCLSNIPLVKSLPNLTNSLNSLSLRALESLQCIPSLSAISSLRNLKLSNIPLLKSLPNLPPSLSTLNLGKFENLDPDFLLSCLPTLSSLDWLSIDTVPSLQELPDLPRSLRGLSLSNLSNLVCLPSCLPTLSSLESLSIRNVPKLQELPDLPSSLNYLSIYDCDPEFMKRYRIGEGSNWHKIAHIPRVHIPTN